MCNKSRKLASVLYVLIFALAAIVIYGAYTFSENVQRLEQSISINNREPLISSALFDKLLKADRSNRPPYDDIARALAYEKSDVFPRNNLAWAIKFKAWTTFTKIYYSDEEIYKVYYKYAPNGKGVEALALQNFTKSVSELNDKQTAALVVFLRYPNKKITDNEIIEKTNAVLLKAQQ